LLLASAREFLPIASVRGLAAASLPTRPRAAVGSTTEKLALAYGQIDSDRAVSESILVSARCGGLLGQLFHVVELAL